MVIIVFTNNYTIDILHIFLAADIYSQEVDKNDKMESSKS